MDNWKHLIWEIPLCALVCRTVDYYKVPIYWLIIALSIAAFITVIIKRRENGD